MQTLNLILKTLFSGKIKFISYCAICAFALSFCVGLAPDLIHLCSIPKNTVSFLSNLLLGIGTSTLAAALITTFDLININKVANLIKLFSFDKTKKTAIVIPQFDKKYFYEKEEGNYNRNDKTPNEITFISYADFNTAKFLVALFQEHNLGVPEIITDDEALEIIANKERVKKYKTFISLGLYSNTFSHLINSEELNNRFFSFSARNIQDSGERVLKFLEPMKDNKGQWRTLTPNNQDCSDLAMISKIDYALPSKQSLSIVILGGLNATGTKLLGEYIYKYWDRVLCKLLARNGSNDQKVLLNERNFCLIFRVTGIKSVRYDEQAELQLDPIFSRV